MDINIRRPDGVWEKIDISSELVSRRAANNTWYSFDPNGKQVISKKVDKAWEDQVPKVRYR